MERNPGTSATQERARAGETAAPVSDLAALSLAFQRLGEGAAELARTLGNAARTIGPAGSNLYDNGDSYALQLALPGVRPGDIRVACGHRHVRVSAPIQAVDLGKPTWRGISQTPDWSVSLPGGVDPASATATFENGMLTIWCQKAADEGKAIRVEDRSGQTQGSR